LNFDLLIRASIVDQRLGGYERRQAEAMKRKDKVIGLDHTSVSNPRVDGSLQAVNCVEKVS